MESLLDQPNKSSTSCLESRNQSSNQSIRTETKAAVFGYIRLNIELNNQYELTQVIPEEIMMICYDYYGHDFISSSILNGTQRDKLFRLLLTKQPNLIPGTTNKIFTASTDGFDANSFYSKCNNNIAITNNNNKNNNNKKLHTILIIKSNWGNIFGAYTGIEYIFDNGYSAETNINNTFLYSLNNNNIFEIKERDLEYAVFHGGNGARDLDSDIIFYFGAAAAILLYENCNLRNDNFCYGGNKCGYKIEKGNMLCGGNKINRHYNDKYEFTVENFELFTVDINK